MPVLELTHLRTLPSPTIPNRSAITKALQEVRTLLAEKVHATNSLFYIPVEEPESKDATMPSPLNVYILGEWPEIATHLEFLQNKELKEDVLGPQEGMLDWVRGNHYALPLRTGLDTAEDGLKVLPLEAPVLVLAFLGREGDEQLKEMNGDAKGVLERVNTLIRGRYRGVTLPLLDDEGVKGSGEVVVSGWKSVEEFGECFGQESDIKLGGTREGVEVVVLRNLEGIFA